MHDDDATSAALVRAQQHVLEAYGPDGEDMLIDICRRALEHLHDDGQPLPLRWSVVCAQLVDSSRQMSSWPVLAQALVVAARHAAFMYRLEMTVATTAIPDAPP